MLREVECPSPGHTVSMWQRLGLILRFSDSKIHALLSKACVLCEGPIISETPGKLFNLLKLGFLPQSREKLFCPFEELLESEFV